MDITDMKNMTKGLCTLKLNSISSVDNDPLLIKTTFSILDFNCSGNGQVISKELAIEASPTLKGKPLLCVYSPNTSTTDEPNDHLNGHGEEVKIDRYGNEYIGTHSIALGGALEGGYITTIKDEDGNDKEILACDFYLWADRNVEVLQLINEMYEQEIPLYSSCEYYFSNYEMQNGVQIVKPPLIFSGHCCLGSGENNSKKVDPAYDSSKMLSFNEKLNNAICKAINQAIKQTNSIDENIENKQEEVQDSMENKILDLLKSNNAISSESLRYKIYDALAKKMVAEEYMSMYLSNYDIYPEEHYFLYETYQSEGGYKLFQCSYSVGENEVVSVDYEGKQEVEYKTELKSVNDLKASLNSKETELATANETIATLQESLNTKETLITEKDEAIKSLNSKIESTDEDKKVTMEKFNELTDVVTSLNAKVKEYEPIVDEYNKEQYEKALNSATDFYKEKFESVGAMDIFEQEETQELIKKSINSSVEEADKAKFALNDLVVTNLKSTNSVVINKETKVSLNAIEPLKDTKDLRKDIDLFEETYGFKR